jgi:hypothetical protein
VRSHRSRWLAALAAVPPFLVALAASGTLPVQAAGLTGTVAPAGLDPSDRVELGAALVVLGMLILAVTVIRLRIQSRRRRTPTLVGSRWARVTDTWEPYRPAPRRTSVRSLW